MAKITFDGRVTIKELRALIPMVAHEITPVIKSEPGCGKTSLLAMISEDNGDKWRKVGDDYPEDKYDYIYVDCPVKDMSDIGMTIPNHQSKTLEYYTASLFKMQSGKPKIILLDEFMKAPKLLQVIFTRLMLERCVGDDPLPSGSMVFGTSNNESDGVGDTMLAHAANRVMITHMAKPSVNDWLEWATDKGISRVIRAFVAMYPRVLKSYLDDGQEDNPYIFKPSSPVLSFCSPRSLAKSDVVVRQADRIPENVLSNALAGIIGRSAANDMATFVVMEKSVVDVRNVVKDPMGIAVPKDIAAQVMVMFQAVDTLDTQDDLSAFMKFVNRIESEEVQSIFFTMAITNTRMVKIARNNEEIKSWAKNNHQLI